MATEEIKIIVNAKDNASKVLKNLGSNLADIGGTVVKAGLAATAAGVAAIGGFLASTIKPASDLSETMSKAGIVFGQFGESISEWGKKSATAFGMSTNEAVAAAATYGNLFRSMNMTETSSYDMSTSLVELASDLASFNNLPTVDVLEKLRAGLTGESEPLKSLGININEAVIKQKALDLGLIKGNETLSAAAKAQAVYALMLEQTTLAQGDFERTSGGLANQQKILASTFENIKSTVGTALLPVITQLAQTMNKWLSDPAITTGLTNFANGIATFAASAIEKIPQVISFFQQVGNWLINNQPIIVGVFAALALAATAWGISTAIAAVTAMAPFLPIIAAMAAVGVAVGLLYAAWTSNFGGIRDTMLYNWSILQSIFNPLKTWLQTYIPIAVQFLSTAWNTILLPALRAVWSFIQTYLFPLFKAITDFINVVFTLAITVFAGIWQNVLLPAFTAVWKFIAEKVMPIFETVASFVGGALTRAFGGITNAISSVIGWLEKLTKKLQNIKLPGWMTPGSPTPWENGLVGVGKALNDLSRAKLPEFEARLKINAPMGIMGDVYNPSTSASKNGGMGISGVNNYNLTVNTNASVENIFSDFRLMKSWANV